MSHSAEGQQMMELLTVPKDQCLAFQGDLVPNNIVFQATGVEILRLSEHKAYYHGREISDDKELVTALREWLQNMSSVSSPLAESKDKP